MLGQRLVQSGEIPLEPLADGLGMATQSITQPPSAAPLEMGVQRLEALERWDRHQEVALRVAHQAFVALGESVPTLAGLRQRAFSGRASGQVAAVTFDFNLDCAADPVRPELQLHLPSNS